MSLTDKIMSSSPQEMNTLGNWAFTASVSTYQLYGQFVSNPTVTSLAVLAAAVTIGAAAEIIYLIRPIIKKVYGPQIDIK